MSEEIVKLNDDQKTFLLKTLKDLHFANRQLHHWVEKDVLSQEMSTTLPSLIESHFCEAAKVLNYESYLTKEKEKRHEELRRANTRVRELEEELGSTKPTDGLKQQLAYLCDVVRHWWDGDGFQHISDIYFQPYGGLNVQFHFMLDHYGMFSETPATDKRDQQAHIQHLRNKGFEFADFEKDRSEKLRLIDNGTNRKLLTNMLRDRFPSIEILSWVNQRSYSNSNIFLLWNIDTMIRDVKDLE